MNEFDNHSPPGTPASDGSGAEPPPETLDQFRSGYEEFQAQVEEELAAGDRSLPFLVRWLRRLRLLWYRRHFARRLAEIEASRRLREAQLRRSREMLTRLRWLIVKVEKREGAVETSPDEMRRWEEELVKTIRFLEKSLERGPGV